ncbi:MAG: tetratricopeptide repeat protein [Bacteroidota bacterium]|nr:tetratricopeptide repeat protein [Bacteroidota bacterium]
MLIKRSIYLLAIALFFVACSTKKNTFVGRGYHNLTARFNGYYYSCVNIDDGIFKIEKNNKENFDKILPVYIYPQGDKAKATFPEFDKAIKKSSTCIQRHAIKDKKNNEIPSSGKWIDNNWINIGIAHVYKRELFSGLEAFEYVARTYTKSKDKYTAMAWMVKTNNEIGSVTSSEQVLSLLKNEKNLPSKIKKELPVLEADYYMRRGLYTEAATKLMAASRLSNPFTGISRKKRARYTFIVAQLFEQQKNNKRAVEFYKRTIKLKPNYELVFYSKIKMAKLLDVKRNNSEKTKKDLLKMAKEFKNNEYYDVIYYTLGEIEEKERNLNQAIYYYKKSVKTSLNNPNQKGQSYLRLGEINFDLTNYQPAGAYYDSAVVTLSKDFPDYETIVARKKTLETLVTHIRTISNEDSLQRFVKLSESDQNRIIDKIIYDLEKEEELALKEKESSAGNNQLPGNGLGAINQPINQDIGAPGMGASFYFYNQNTVSFGVADFTKKWGNRKLEDNWRRSNKALTIDEPTNVNDTAKTKTNNSISSNKTRDYYKQNLPVNDSLIKKSNKKIVYAYYTMGSIYKEELKNNKKAVATFEELNTRFPKNKYLLNTYYILYRTNLADKNQPRADYYKEKILNEFPDSEFALIIKNPSYAEEANSKQSEVEDFYDIVYKSYHEKNYSQSAAQASEGLSKFGKNIYVPKFEFIKALSIGKLKGVDSLEFYLKLLVAKHPQAEVTPLANEILLSIKKQKNPDLYKAAEPGFAQLDTFSVNLEAEHFIIAIVPDDPKIAESFKIRLNTFNNTYYSTKVFNLTSNLFGDNKQLVVLKTFANAKEVITYYEYLIKDPQLFTDEVKRELIDIYPILANNLPFLYKKKNIESYKVFFLDNYKNLTENKIK